MKNIKIAGVVILYQPNELVTSNVMSYADQFDELYLIDNSLQNNEKMFEKILINHKIHYIALYNNYGIAYALNIGFEKSWKTNCMGVISMDQDSSFQTDVLKVYRRYLEQNTTKHIAVLTPQYAIDRNTIKKTCTVKKVKLSMQSGTLFLRDTWEKVGKFNESLFLDVVDWEYFLRIRKNGMKIIRCYEAVLNHQPADTKFVFKVFGKKMGIGKAEPIRYYYQIRNLTWCVKTYKCFSMIKWIIFKYLKIILFFENKTEYLRLCKEGIKDAMNERLGAYEAEH